MAEDRGAGSSPSEDFQRQAEQRSGGLLSEYLDFLRHGKKWYMTPIVVFLLLLGVIVVIGATAAAPLIYTLF